MTTTVCSVFTGRGQHTVRLPQSSLCWAFPANIPVEKHEGGSPVRDGDLTDGFWDVENNTTYEPR